jgi:hypothetical protein
MTVEHSSLRNISEVIETFLQQNHPLSFGHPPNAKSVEFGEAAPSLNTMIKLSDLGKAGRGKELKQKIIL